MISCKRKSSITLKGGQSSVIDLSEAASAGVSFGFNIVMIFPKFQMCSITQYVYE